MSRRTLRCLRCGGTMELLRREFLQLGKTGWVLGDLDYLLAGALDVDILCCSDCGKLEFFRGEWSELEDPEGELIRRYQVQLEYYARALHAATGKPVKQRYLYSFSLGKEISV